MVVLGSGLKLTGFLNVLGLSNNNTRISGLGRNTPKCAHVSSAFVAEACCAEKMISCTSETVAQVQLMWISYSSAPSFSHYFLDVSQLRDMRLLNKIRSRLLAMSSRH